MKSFLIIQTAFIGDVILATGLIEKLHNRFPTAKIDFLLRKGNEGLLANHPHVNQVIIWDKHTSKYSNLLKTIRTVRATNYDRVINLQRYAASGLITLRSRAGHKAGFDKNPLSFCYQTSIKHEIGNGKHETERNHELIADITDSQPSKPVLYPSSNDTEVIRQYQNRPYYCIAPTSVWFTKQLPGSQWVELIEKLPADHKLYLLGGPPDTEACQEIANKAGREVINLAGKLSFLESAALMKGAVRNYVNDSAPMHIASAMNATVTAIFCSTIPNFGFGPLSDDSNIVETTENLDCRPCGLHGFQQCPEGHFKCANTIKTEQLFS